MAGESVPLTVDGWSGSLPELLAAAEAGGVAPASLRLTEVIAAVRAGGLDLEAGSSAFALLGRLVELKARALLPSPPPEVEPPVEPDAEAEAARLAERLAAYQVFTEAAAALREFEQRRAEQFGRPAGPERVRRPAGDAAAPAQGTGLPPGPEALERLLTVFAEVWERARPRTREVQRERFTVGQAVARLRDRLAGAGATEFAGLFDPDADRLEVVVTFLALLELVRLGEVAVRQDAPFAAVRIDWLGRRTGATDTDAPGGSDRTRRHRPAPAAPASDAEEGGGA